MPWSRPVFVTMAYGADKLLSHICYFSSVVFVSNILQDLTYQIEALENKPREYKIDDMIIAFQEWGQITAKLRTLSEHISQEHLVENSLRLSKLLTVMITEMGLCDDYSPLPEMVCFLREGKKFDFIEADSVTALVYCTHKIIECLSIIAADNKQ